MAIINLLCAVVLLAVVPVQSERHSLYYIYTALSKPVSLPGIYEFTAMGLLNDRQVDYYNSQEQKKIPKQHWMEQKMEKDYWDKGTQSRKSKQQWFNVNVNILMERMRHNNTDVHVLQWRHGCEINLKDGTSEFIKGIDEYSYDGENFLSFDDKDSQWVAPVNEALPTKRKWDNVPILNQYTKGYLEKECVDWLNKFREYGDEELKKHSPPEVHVFAKRTVSDTTKLKLTCLATGFYPKDVTLKIRKYRTSLADSETESTGVRPNHDGTYQLRTSVEIKEDEKADYECYVTHRTLTEPIIVKWKGDCNNCTKGNIMHLAIGIVLGALIVLGVAAGVFLYRRKRRTDDNSTKGKAGSGGDISSDSGKESLDGSDPMLPSGKESPDSSDPMLPSGTTGTEGGSSSDSGKSSGSEENRFSNFLGKTPV